MHTIHSPPHHLTTSHFLVAAFERMSDRSAYITAEDIKTLLGNTDYDVDKIMEEVGLQYDSTINFDQVSWVLLVCGAQISTSSFDLLCTVGPCCSC